MDGVSIDVLKYKRLSRTTSEGSRLREGGGTASPTPVHIQIDITLWKLERE